MLRFTFDTNCIIDLDVGTPPAQFVRSIIAAHRNGQADAAFVAVSASERQKGDFYLPTYKTFVQRLASLGVQDIPQILGMAYWGLSYWDRALHPSPEATERERQIHKFLFPSLSFDFADFADSNNIAAGDVLSPKAKKWRNAWCDRQMLWAHDFHARDVFVTNDRNFLKLAGSVSFENLRVHTPEEAVVLLRP
ncbi:MAG: hypothetical protein LCH69_04035 [Proteobacteria bacterium]|nr:hypothetical protein [Pseudomonadota bacterium]